MSFVISPSELTEATLYNTISYQLLINTHQTSIWFLFPYSCYLPQSWKYFTIFFNKFLFTNIPLLFIAVDIWNLWQLWPDWRCVFMSAAMRNSWLLFYTEERKGSMIGTLLRAWINNYTLRILVNFSNKNYNDQLYYAQC